MEKMKKTIGGALRSNTPRGLSGRVYSYSIAYTLYAVVAPQLITSPSRRLYICIYLRYISCVYIRIVYYMYMYIQNEQPAYKLVFSIWIINHVGTDENNNNFDFYWTRANRGGGDAFSTLHSLDIYIYIQKQWRRRRVVVAGNNNYNNIDVVRVCTIII